MKSFIVICLTNIHFINFNVSFQCCMIMSFVTFLEKGSLITRKECAEILGLDATQSSTNFHLELEDYLIGVLDTCSELARLAPNSVVAGNMGKFTYELMVNLNSRF